MRPFPMVATPVRRAPCWGGHRRRRESLAATCHARRCGLYPETEHRSSGSGPGLGSSARRRRCVRELNPESMSRLALAPCRRIACRSAVSGVSARPRKAARCARPARAECRSPMAIRTSRTLSPSSTTRPRSADEDAVGQKAFDGELRRLPMILGIGGPTTRHRPGHQSATIYQIRWTAANASYRLRVADSASSARAVALWMTVTACATFVLHRRTRHSALAGARSRQALRGRALTP